MLYLPLSCLNKTQCNIIYIYIPLHGDIHAPCNIIYIHTLSIYYIYFIYCNDIPADEEDTHCLKYYTLCLKCHFIFIKRFAVRHMVRVLHPWHYQLSHRSPRKSCPTYPKYQQHSRGYTPLYQAGTCTTPHR